MKEIIIILAEGFEEMEAIILIDILRRSGLHVTVFGLGSRQIRGAHNILIETDSCDDSLLEKNWDLVLLPGGLPGSTNLRDDERVITLIQRQINSGRLAGAICAAPIVLEKAGVLKGCYATSYPSFREHLKSSTYSEERVVDSGQIMTSRGPGTAFEFALHIVSRLAGKEKARELSQAMLIAQ